MAATPGVNLPYCALATSSPTSCAPASTRPAFTGSFLSSLVGLLLGALLGGLRRPGYLAMGAAAGAVAVWAHPALGLGLAPAARGLAAAIGRPEPITAQLGASAQWPLSCAWWVVSAALGQRSI